jgi:ATP-dependent Lon protease
MEHSQREYYLREQLKVIQEELGQGEGASETEEFKQKILKSKMPKEIEKKALHELNRLIKMPSMSAEATVVRTYLDWLIELPWHRSSREHLDIAVAKKTLDADHYGLEDVKDRILEYLAVQKLGGIRCEGKLSASWDPGVGKTSLARSIARALNRKFAKCPWAG